MGAIFAPILVSIFVLMYHIGQVVSFVSPCSHLNFYSAHISKRLRLRCAAGPWSRRRAGFNKINTIHYSNNIEHAYHVDSSRKKLDLDETRENSAPIRLPLPFLKTCESFPKLCSRSQFVSQLISSTVATASITLTQLPSPAKATYIDPKSKINLPFMNEIENAIPTNWSDIDNPFDPNELLSSSSVSFSRLDSSNDFIFYKDARFVEHVDDNAVSIMQDYITNQVLKPNMDVLDLCSSWTSHVTTQTKDTLQLKRFAGLGMNEQELKNNPILTDYIVMNLNTKNNDGRLKLPYDNSSFDVVLCQLSIDYLIYPLDVMREIGRILKPGGSVVILFSNRLFLQKAVGLWTGADDVDHAYIVGSYIFFSNGGFIPSSIKAKDLSLRNKKGMIIGDPMYVVTAQKMK